ncbi:hypothetical protein J1N35_018753 [Gossypium stocksii]|uniref:CCHC-type domain-containing protein n=1 Tax=Gossypium stocksii TaxID=47602 RepID=A0A9D4A7H9_9ROSI|nr:hypothetical protein J1N35_018753 [Gossypium stocksii]
MSEEHSPSRLISTNDDAGASQSVEDRTTKKVRFKDGLDEALEDMVVDHGLSSTSSWKDKLFGGVSDSFGMDRNISPLRREGKNTRDFDLLANYVQTSTVNGVLAFYFSDWVKELLFKEMELIVVIKLLGQNIGYNTLHNRIISLWKPISHFHLIDIKNGYYLPSATIPKCGVGLDSTARSTRVYVSKANCGGYWGAYWKVLVDGTIQQVEYEALPTVCFNCGKYGHVRDLCSSVALDWVLDRLPETACVALDSNGRGAVEEMGPEYGPWMLAERRSRRGQRNGRNKAGVNNGELNKAKSSKEVGGSHFAALNAMGETSENHTTSAGDFSSRKGVDSVSVKGQKLALRFLRVLIRGLGYYFGEFGLN